LVNLAINAQQAMLNGGRVVLGSHLADNNAVVLSVSDNGPGIPAELRDRVFDPFFTTKTDTGTGLGLAISRSIVSEHGGELTLDCNEGQGCRFSIRLPVAESEATSDQ